MVHQAPKVVISGPNKTAVYHLWSEVEVEDAYEVTNKSGRGSKNAVLLTTRLPAAVRVSVMCSDELVVPTISNIPSAETQGAVSRTQQIETLRSFIGQVVTIDARTIPGGITGVVNRVTISDDGKWDNTVKASFTLQQILGVGSDGRPLGVDVAFGKITVAVSDGSKESGGDAKCVPGQVRIFQPGLRSIRENVSEVYGHAKSGLSKWWSNRKADYNDIKSKAKDFGSGLKDLGRALTGKATINGEDNPVIKFGLSIGFLDKEVVDCPT